MTDLLRLNTRRALTALTVLFAVLAIVFGVNLHPASAAPGAESRVRASGESIQPFVGPPRDVSPGQHWGSKLSSGRFVVATGVAAKSGAEVPTGTRVTTKTFTNESGKTVRTKYGWEMKVAPGTNAPATIGGRAYSGHALDQMQGRGIMPSAVDSAIKYGESVPSRGNSTVFYQYVNDLSVVVNENGRVITTSFGDLR